MANNYFQKFKKLAQDKVKDYNIVSNKYWKEHDRKSLRDEKIVKDKLDELFWRNHDFDFIKCKYINDEKENKFIEDRTAKMKVHGIHNIEKLPPSLRHRETAYFDTTKPVPKQILEIDEMNKQRKVQYKMRYKIQKKLQEDDIEK